MRGHRCKLGPQERVKPPESRASVSPSTYRRERGRDLVAFPAGDAPYFHSKEVGEDAANTKAGELAISWARLQTRLCSATTFRHVRDTWHNSWNALAAPGSDAQAQLANTSQPGADDDVGLASLDLLDVLGVEQQGFDAGPGDGAECSVGIRRDRFACPDHVLRSARKWNWNLQRLNRNTAAPRN